MGRDVYVLVAMPDPAAKLAVATAVSTAGDHPVYPRRQLITLNGRRTVIQRATPPAVVCTGSHSSVIVRYGDLRYLPAKDRRGIYWHFRPPGRYDPNAKHVVVEQLDLSWIGRNHWVMIYDHHPAKTAWGWWLLLVLVLIVIWFK